jgi:hypothetical protein
MRRHRSSVPRPIPQTLPTIRPSFNPSAIFDAALKANEKRTGRNLVVYPFATQQQARDSPEAMLTILQTQAAHFGSSWVGIEKLRTWLDPAVNVLYAFSATLGGGISPVTINSTVENLTLMSIRQRVSPTKAFFAGIGVLFTVSDLLNPFVRVSVISRVLRQLKMYPKPSLEPS